MKRRINEFYEAIRAQDVDRITAWFRPDAKHRVYSASVSGQTEFAGECEGIATIAARFAAFRQDWTIAELTVVDVVIDGVKGAATLLVRANATSGRRTLMVRSMHFLTFDGELIVEFDVFINEMELRRVEPAMAEPSA